VKRRRRKRRRRRRRRKVYSRLTQEDKEEEDKEEEESLWGDTRGNQRESPPKFLTTRIPAGYSSCTPYGYRIQGNPRGTGTGTGYRVRCN